MELKLFKDESTKYERYSLTLIYATFPPPADNCYETK